MVGKRHNRVRWLVGVRPALWGALGAGGILAGLAVASGWSPLRIDPGPGPGQVGVLISVRPLPAYQRIALRDLVDPRSGQLERVFLDARHARDTMFTRPSQIVGRVLRRDKPAGLAFGESDFAPPGTRPGLAAGIPPGKRALRVAVREVTGLEELRRGDRFDLVATLPLDPGALSDISATGIQTAAMAALDPRIANWKQQATVEVIVQNGVLVEPVATRTFPVVVRTFTQGPLTRTQTVQEVVVAIEPEEVARLTQAVAVGAEIQSVIRSNHPDDPWDSATPDSSPRSLWDLLAGEPRSGDRGYTLVEALDSSGRRMMPVRRAAPPGPAAGGDGVQGRRP